MLQKEKIYKVKRQMKPWLGSSIGWSIIPDTPNKGQLEESHYKT